MTPYFDATSAWAPINEGEVSGYPIRKSINLSLSEVEDIETPPALDTPVPAQTADSVDPAPSEAEEVESLWETEVNSSDSSVQFAKIAALK